MCVLGKQALVGCDCLIPRGLSFHSFSCLIPHHSAGLQGLWVLGPTCLYRQPAPPGLLILYCREMAVSERQTVLEHVFHLSSLVSLSSRGLLRSLATFHRMSGSDKDNYFV